MKVEVRSFAKRYVQAKTTIHVTATNPQRSVKFRAPEGSS